MPYKDADERRAKGREATARWNARRTEEQRAHQRDLARAWRARNRERHRQYSRDYVSSHKKSCPQCGADMQYDSSLCAKCHRRQRGSASVAWRGGRAMNHGYVLVYAPQHPRQTKSGYVLEHILVVEKRLGRYLYPNERIHHKNGKRDDNRSTNLELWTVSHPSGQRVEDVLAWAKEIVLLYG